MASVPQLFWTIYTLTGKREHYIVRFRKIFKNAKRIKIFAKEEETGSDTRCFFDIVHLFF